MSLDLGSTTLEVVIALSFVFFLLSVIVTELGEWLTAILGSRAKTLRKGLEGMLGDENLVRAVLDHALVRTNLKRKPRTEKREWKEVLKSPFVPELRRERGPSYVAPRNFALVVKSELGKAAKDDPDIDSSAPDSVFVVPSSKAELKDEKNRAVAEPALVKQLETLLVDAADDVKIPELPALEKWFDDAMDRVSGWYKRKSQLITVFLAVVVTVGFNVDAIRVSERIANDPTVRSKLAEGGEAVNPATAGAAGVPEETPEEKQAAALAAAEGAEGAIEELDALNLPILWDEANDDVTGETLIGWLITIIAISLGAPFWFDALGRLSRMRASGKKPKDDPQTT